MNLVYITLQTHYKQVRVLKSLGELSNEQTNFVEQTEIFEAINQLIVETMTLYNGVWVLRT